MLKRVQHDEGGGNEMLSYTTRVMHDGEMNSATLDMEKLALDAAKVTAFALLSVTFVALSAELAR